MPILVPNVTRMTYSFSKNVPYNISTNEVVSDKLGRARGDVEEMTIDDQVFSRWTQEWEGTVV